MADDDQPGKADASDSPVDGVPIGRRGVLTGAALGAVGLGGYHFGTGRADEGNSEQRFAHLGHDHSGDFDDESHLGSLSPVDSITVSDLRTRAAPVIDVRAYGAEGDGETDDHAAVQEAVNDVEAGAVIYFPAGRYMLSDAITAHDKSLAIRGDGPGVTHVDFTERTDGFDITQPGSNEASPVDERYVLVADLTIGVHERRSGTAISADWGSPPQGGHPHLVVRNVNVRNHDGYFTRGIFADNAWRARVLDFHYVGTHSEIPFGDVDEWDPHTIGIEFRGRCVDSCITRAHLSRCGEGIHVGGGAGRPNTEGVRIHEATLVDTYKGVVAESGPWLTVTSSHFNGRKTGVEFQNRWEAMVSDCLFYRVGWAETSEWAGVHAISTHNITVTNVSIGDFSDEPTKGHAVYFEACRDCVASGNVMNGLDFEKSSTVEVNGRRIVVSENIARDAPHAVTLTTFSEECLAHGNWGAVVDDGVDNLVANNLTPSGDE